MPESNLHLESTLLVLRCQAGDAAAFAELVGQYHRRVHYYLKKMLGSPDRADDALQELWIDVFRSIPKLREASAFSPWLYRLARDRAYRVIRRADPPTEAIDVADVTEESETDVFTHEDAAHVHEALDQLGPEHREVLLLKFVESMSYQQIAAVVGCELGTVRSRIHYAKRALRALLERKANESERIRITTHETRPPLKH